MENSNMYDQVKKLLDYYKKKVVENGPSSLTPDDITNLKNMYSVMELIRGTALEMIVTDAIEGNFTSIKNYYLEKEQEIIDKYAEYEQREQELSGELVEAIAKDDKAAEEKVKKEFVLIAEQKEKFNNEMQQFKDSQLTPTDFVKKIIGDDTSKTLMARVATRLAQTSIYVANPSLEDEAHFIEIKDGKIVVNEPLVDLATDYLQGIDTYFDLLNNIEVCKNKIKNIQSISEDTSYMFRFARTARLYRQCVKWKDKKFALLKKYRQAQTHFWSRNVKVDGEEVSIYTIKEVEKDYERAVDNCEKELSYLLFCYQRIKKAFIEADVEFTLDDKMVYDASESFVENLTILVDYSFMPVAKKKIEKLQLEIRKNESRLDPKYKDVDLSHMDRILHYGLDRIDNPDNQTFDSTLEALKLLKYVSKINNKELKPEELIESSEISDVKQNATNVIDDYLAEQRRSL